MEKIFFAFLLVISFSVSAQSITYKTTVLDSIIIENKTLVPSHYFSLVLHMNSKYIFYLNRRTQTVAQYSSTGTFIENIKFGSTPKEQKKFPSIHGIRADEKYLHILTIPGTYYQYDLEKKKITNSVQATKKYDKLKLIRYTSLTVFDIYRNFIYDTELKKYVFPLLSEYVFYPKKLKKLLKKGVSTVPNALSTLAVVNEKGEIDYLFPMLKSPYSLYVKYFLFHLHPTFAYNAQKKLYYFSSERNQDILAVNLKDYSNFSFGEKVKSIKFVPPKDTSLAMFDSLMAMSKNLYLVKKMQENGGFWSMRYDPHYNVLFRSYTIVNPEYNKLYDEHMSKVSWNQCGVPKVQFTWVGEKYKLFTQVYSPEGKYLGTTEYKNQYSPLTKVVLYQEGNTYWIRGPITYGKWTIYKVKMDLEVESLEK